MCLNSEGGGIVVGAPGLFSIADGVDGIRNGGAEKAAGDRRIDHVGWKGSWVKIII